MSGTIKSWFQPTQEPVVENKWDANTLTMRQPSSPAMNQTIEEQPVRSLLRGNAGIVVTHSCRLHLSQWMSTCKLTGWAKMCAVDWRYELWRIDDLSSLS